MPKFDALQALRDSAAGKHTPHSEKLVSTSSLYHQAPGICPKCSATMQIVKTHMDEAFFCKSCRVTNPLPNTK